MTREIIESTIHICQLISEHNLSKAKLDKTQNKTHWENYNNFIVPAINEFKSQNNTATPNKILSRFLNDYIEKNNLTGAFASSDFHIVGRFINPYFWACIHEKHSESQQYTKSPQLYILINKHGIKFGFDYGNAVKRTDPAVQLVLSDVRLQKKVLDAYKQVEGLKIYADVEASEEPEPRNELKSFNQQDVGENWDENTHVIAYYPILNLPDNLDGKITETFDQLLELFKMTSSDTANKIDTAKSDRQEDEEPLRMGLSSEKNKYWLYAPGERARLWEEFYEEGIIGIGWDYLGELSSYRTKQDIANAIKTYKGGDSSRKNDARACYDFIYTLKQGDIIIAKRGRKEYLGYGVVKSEYIFDASRPEYKNIRKVNWLKKGRWQETANSNSLKNINGYYSIQGLCQETEQPSWHRFNRY